MPGNFLSRFAEVYLAFKVFQSISGLALFTYTCRCSYDVLCFDLRGADMQTPTR